MWHEGLRTRAAKLAAAGAALKRGAGRSDAPFSLAFMTDNERVPSPDAVIAALPPGSAVIFRDYSAPRRLRIAQRLASLARAKGVLFILGGNPALATRIGADGVHAPGWMAQNIGAATTLGLLTAACHSLADLQRAASHGANAAFLSPVFPTGSHPGARTLGPKAFREIAAASPIPVLALGGVDEANAAFLTGPNVVGVAAISAFLPR